MLFRVADVFVTGPSGKQQTDSDRWSALSQNTKSLVAFFDILTFSHQLSLIDYGATFAPPEGYEVSRLYDLVNKIHGDLPAANRYPSPLVSVHVKGAAHDQARAGAIEKMNERRQVPVEASLAETIAYELHAFEHAWRPNLTDYDPRYTWDFDTPERRVDTFLYGVLLFGHSANQANVPHVLYGLRGKLDQAAALNAKPSFRFDGEPGVDIDEAALDEALTKVLQSALGEAGAWLEGMRALPPVLPYLLQTYEPGSITELLLRALELRATDTMAEYRDWKNAAVASYKRTGAVPTDVQRDVRKAADAVARALEPASPDLKWTWLIVPVPTLPAVWASRQGNWALATIPGRNHIKMLYRLRLASHNAALGARSLESPLGTLWRQSDLRG